MPAKLPSGKKGMGLPKSKDKSMPQFNVKNAAGKKTGGIAGEPSIRKPGLPTGGKMP